MQDDAKDIRRHLSRSLQNYKRSFGCFRAKLRSMQTPDPLTGTYTFDTLKKHVDRSKCIGMAHIGFIQGKKKRA